MHDIPRNIDHLISFLFQGVSAFSPILKEKVAPSRHAGTHSCSRNQNGELINFGRLSPLCMGRAAAVREKTKSKTDAKKAKTNAIYGKKIIMVRYMSNANSFIS